MPIGGRSWLQVQVILECEGVGNGGIADVGPERQASRGEPVEDIGGEHRHLEVLRHQDREGFGHGGEVVLRWHSPNVGRRTPGRTR